jgi:VWFA-related protein
MATFRGGIDMVRVAAIVRDRKGRFVQDLTARDFEVFDTGQARQIADFRNDVTGVSVAILFDVSGSMEGQLRFAREAATHVLSWLDTRDEASVFTFDTQLDQRAPFTVGLRTLPEAMSRVVPFGATSLHDAIAQTARQVGEREGRRRAVVVLTDGAGIRWKFGRARRNSPFGLGVGTSRGNHARRFSRRIVTWCGIYYSSFRLRRWPSADRPPALPRSSFVRPSAK